MHLIIWHNQRCLICRLTSLLLLTTSTGWCKLRQLVPYAPFLKNYKYPNITLKSAGTPWCQDNGGEVNKNTAKRKPSHSVTGKVDVGAPFKVPFGKRRTQTLNWNTALDLGVGVVVVTGFGLYSEWGVDGDGVRRREGWSSQNAQTYRY